MADSAAITPRFTLVGGWWIWSATINCGIKFNADGTGELVCGVELAHFIAAIFTWEPLTDQDARFLRQADIHDGTATPPANISLTLTRRCMPGTERWTPPGAVLTEDAFRAKTYTIHISKGKFPVVDQTSTGYCVWYSQHLEMSPSPYPPLEEWAQKQPVDRIKFWERSDFHRLEIDGDQFFDPHTGLSRREEMEQVRANIQAKLASIREHQSRE